MASARTTVEVNGVRLSLWREGVGVFPVERSREIAAAIPGARLEMVAGGHQSNVDQPEATSRLIHEFLDRSASVEDARH